MERGTVIEIRGGKILVETGADSLCGSCSISHSCMIGADGARRRLWMDYDSGARVGDEVAFEIAEKEIVAGAAVVYLIPVLMLIGGIVLGAFAGGRFGIGGDMPLVAGGAAGLLLSVLVSWTVSSIMKKKKIAVPRLIDITRRD
jgi:sigma-E factor negative regulatory protein RseC